MGNYKYVGLFLVILTFGILFIPKIINRISNNTMVQDGRSKPADPLQYIMLNGEAKSVPEFALLNQDSLFISNEDFKEKVYVAEFFFRVGKDNLHIFLCLCKLKPKSNILSARLRFSFRSINLFYGFHAKFVLCFILEQCWNCGFGTWSGV